MAYQISSQSQTLELLVAYHQDPSVHLRNRIVNLNVGLVRKITHRVVNQCHVPFEDLEQVGYMGLIRAVDQFDSTKGYAFSTFAVPHIKGEILHFLRDRANIVRIPRNLQQLKSDGDKAHQILIARLGRQPNDLEIASELDIDVDEWHLVKLSWINRTVRSLDAQLLSESHQQLNSTMTFGETLLDIRNQIQQDNAEECLALQHALNQLEDTTREIIESVFLHQQTRQEVARRIGISPVTVSRRIHKGIIKLAKLLQQSSLDHLVES
jgi:RNA polymerase sigma-B factor